MIAQLRGTLVESSFAHCVVDAGGVGYDVAIPVSTFEKLPHPGEPVTLKIHTQVREDAIVLFGFATTEEKELFRALINVTGVGGKLALNVLSAMPVVSFCQAVSAGDVKMLSRIIGKRTAERLVVELRERLSGVGAGSPVPGLSAELSTAAGDTAAALEQLGFKRDAIDKTLRRLLSELPAAECTCENLLRKAIQQLNF